MHTASEATDASALPAAAVRRDRLRRLLAPRNLAVVGGAAAAEVVRQSRIMGFSGPVYAVNPRRRDTAGVPCLATVADLPESPDAVFIGVPADETVDVVTELAAIGAGGAVCYASGFAEMGLEGAGRQRRLVAAAADMPVLGPNCYGYLNYLDGAALWPDVHGGRPVRRGVAVVTQSGNIGLNLTMQRRGLPLGYLVTAGNMAAVGVADLLDALVDDDRVTAVGLHVEGIDDVAALCRAAIRAHERGLPVVVLKTGRSDAGAQAATTHTSSLSGPDHLYDVLFERLGIPRLADLDELLETLLLLHVHGGLPGERVAFASCSGGEASLVADLADAFGLQTPALGAQATARLAEVLGDRVRIANPLDFHTYIWGDRAAMAECFTGLLCAPIDLGLLLLDVPREDRCSAAPWADAADAFVTASLRTGTRAAVVSTLGECMPEAVADALVERGVAPLRGLRTALRAVAAAVQAGQARTAGVSPVPGPARSATDRPTAVPADEWRAKRLLASAGVRVPHGRLVEDPDEDTRVAAAVRAAGELGHPVVVKAVGPGLEHKTESGAVALHLDGPAAVEAAARRMSRIGSALLVESMVTGAVAELVVGVRHDPSVGHALTMGAGGVLVELLRDTVTLLLPVVADDVRQAIARLRIAPVLAGHRGAPAADVDAAVSVVLAVAAMVGEDDGLLDIEINPLLVLPAGQGAVAVDALVVRR